MSVAAGYSAGADLRNAVTKQAAQRQSAYQQRTNNANNAIKGVVDQAAQLVKAYQNGQINMSPQEFQQNLSAFMDNAVHTSELAQRMGLQTVTPDALNTLKTNLMQSATQQQVAANQGMAAGTKAVGQAAQVTNLVPGASSREAMIASGAIKPEPKGTTINVGTGQKAFDAQRGKNEANRLKTLVSQADDSEQLVNTADSFLSFSKDVETGAFAPAKYKAAAWVQGLGLDPNKTFGANVGAAQAMNAVGNQLALKLRKEMPGQLSNQDVKFLVAANLNLGNTPSGNQLLANAIKLVAQRKREKANMAQQWADDHGTLRGFDKAWEQYINDNPLFSQQQPPQQTQKTGGSTSGWSIEKAQ
jgi:hypothetical protein